MNAAQVVLICIPAGVATWIGRLGVHRHHRLHPAQPSSGAALAALGRVNARLTHQLHH